MATQIVVLNPWSQATSGVFGDPWCQATRGVFCVQPAAFKPPGAGRKRPRKKYYADDVDLEQMRIRSRVLRDRRDMRDLMEMVRLLSEVN